jgi:hypothetical protein
LRISATSRRHREARLATAQFAEKFVLAHDPSGIGIAADLTRDVAIAHRIDRLPIHGGFCQVGALSRDRGQDGSILSFHVSLLSSQSDHARFAIVYGILRKRHCPFVISNRPSLGTPACCTGGLSRTKSAVKLQAIAPSGPGALQAPLRKFLISPGTRQLDALGAQILAQISGGRDRLCTGDPLHNSANSRQGE